MSLDHDTYADEYVDEPQGRILWGRFAFWGLALLVVFVLGRACAPTDDGRAEEVMRLTEEKTQLEQENAALQERVEALEAGVAENAEDTEDTDEPAEEGETYVVESGDTLRGIAERVYGDADRIEPIIEANGLDSDAQLQVGQELRIPPVDE